MSGQPPHSAASNTVDVYVDLDELWPYFHLAAESHYGAPPKGTVPKELWDNYQTASRAFWQLYHQIEELLELRKRFDV